MKFEDTIKRNLSEKEIRQLLASLEKEPTHSLLLNTKKISNEEFRERFPLVTPHPLIENAFLYKKEDYEFGKMALYELGAYSIQDASSMLDIYFLNPKEGEIVLDLCAAPGGKTIGASLNMNNKGLILANDLSYERAKSLSSNIERMGCQNVIVTSNDFSKVFKKYPNTFDKIILDAPCSGSAMFRKNEEAKKLWSYSKVIECSSIQKQLLDIAYYMLKPGGRIIYSTCSFSAEENEDVIKDFLAKYDDIKIVKMNIPPSLFSSKILEGCLYALPYLFSGEGQFVCLLEKGNTKTTQYKPFKSNNKIINSLLEQYGLQNRSNIILNKCLYSGPLEFDISKLNVLRYGIKVTEITPQNTPEFALARAYEGPERIEVSLEQALKYLHGDTFPLTKNNGFYIVMFNNLNLGFVKVVNGIAKNYYPKGLRRMYKTI